MAGESIIIKFENPPGNELTNLAFEPGQDLRIGAKVKDVLGLGSPGLHVDFQVTRTEGTDFSPLVFDGTTNWLGDIWFDTSLPNVVAKAQVQVTAYWLIGPPTVALANIGIGTIPESPPGPPFDLTTWMSQYGPTILIVSAVVFGGLYLATWLPKSPYKKSVLSRNPMQRRLKWH